MKPTTSVSFYQVVGVLGLLFATTSAQAALRVIPWPLTATAHERVEIQKVQVETSLSFNEWSQKVGTYNSHFGEDLVVVPVASIQMDVVGQDEPEVTLKALSRRAQKEAAWTGANLICLDKTTPGTGKGYLSARFTAYRVQYRDRLVEAPTLASLPTTPVSGLAMGYADQEQLRWTTPSVLNEEGSKRTPDLMAYLEKLGQGAAVRLELADGSSIEGTFNGIDEENRIWIHPRNASRWVADRAYRPSDIHLVVRADQPKPVASVASLY